MSPPAGNDNCHIMSLNGMQCLEIAGNHDNMHRVGRHRLRTKWGYLNVCRSPRLGRSRGPVIRCSEASFVKSNDICGMGDEAPEIIPCH